MNAVGFKKGISVIGDTAFYGCVALESVELPQSLLSIGTEAFSGCTKLSDVTISKNTLSIKAAAFAGCIFKDVTINKICSYQSDSFPEGITINNY